MNRYRKGTGILVTLVLAQGKLAWISWVQKCSFRSLPNNRTKVTQKLWVGSKPGPQNRNIISSSKIFNLWSLHRMNSILLAGARSLVSCRIMNYGYGTSVWPVPWGPAQGLPRSQSFFPSKTWFLGIYLNFQQQKSLKYQYLPHFESKSYQINSIKSCS